MPSTAFDQILEAAAKRIEISNRPSRFREGEVRKNGVREFAKFALNYRGHRRIIAREYLFRAAARFTPVIAHEVDGIRYILNTADKDISRYVFSRGYYEREEMRDTLATLTRVYGRPFTLDGKTFVDIGSNIGTSTLCATLCFGAARSVAFEPNPLNFRFLRHNIVENGLEDRVRAFQRAVSDTDGVLEFELAKINMGDGRVRADVADRGTVYGEDTREVIQVGATKLDTMVEEGEADISGAGLVWMDVQGHEGQALAGASALIETGAPVCMEYWPYALRNGGGLSLLEEVVTARFTHIVDMENRDDGDAIALQPAENIALLKDRYTQPRSSTNLLLLRL